MHSEKPLLEKYRQYLPLPAQAKIISLQEGNTPLVQAQNLPARIGCPELKLYFKLEGLNPSGSFKDRGMTMAVTMAAHENSQAIICASTGNTSAAAAAFAAKAGLACYVLLPAGKVALGKLAQAILYGATVVQIEGNFDQALELVRAISEKHGLTVVNSINPFRLEGQKTAALEIVETLGDAPDRLLIPVGNAGNISAYYRGFKLYGQEKRSSKIPAMCGFQAAGAAPMVLGKAIDNPETIATAIRIGNPASWKEAATAIEESKGCIEAVTDEEILAAYKLIASCEGIFCEPASAASVAGLIKLAAGGHLKPGETAVCVLTGNGLKDPDSALKLSQVDLKPVAAEINSLSRAMKL
ncbi:MAG: threonine synthase [Candidatus Obscuribacterales bacterium]|nr:threonine synthase [Candidatus Obscuribacterales bacterium]